MYITYVDDFFDILSLSREGNVMKNYWMMTFGLVPIGSDTLLADHFALCSFSFVRTDVRTEVVDLVSTFKAGKFNLI